MTDVGEMLNLERGAYAQPKDKNEECLATIGHISWSERIILPDHILPHDVDTFVMSIIAIIRVQASDLCRGSSRAGCCPKISSMLYARSVCSTYGSPGFKCHHDIDAPRRHQSRHLWEMSADQVCSVITFSVCLRNYRANIWLLLCSFDPFVERIVGTTYCHPLFS